MKILIQHRHKDFEITGVVTYIDTLLEELSRRGIECRVVSTSETSSAEWMKHILWADIVFMHSNNPGFIALSRLLSKKVALMYHYKFYLTESSKNLHSFSERLMAELKHILDMRHLPLRWKLERGVQLIRLLGRLTSAFLAHELLANTQFMANSTSIPRDITVPPFPCPRLISTNPKSYSDLDRPFTFTFVGRLCKEKGVDLLLDATHMLSDKYDDFNVKIIGDGSSYNSMKELVRKHNISSKVDFLGRLKIDETITHMRQSIAVVIPSRWQEPAGRVLLEAASVGTLVIAANVGGLPELGGKECMYFEKEDSTGLFKAMRHVLNNPEMAFRSGSSLQQRIREEHNVVRHTEQLLDLFREI